MKERLTTDKTKIFVRENPTLMSITKDELRKLYNEVFDRLQEYEVAEEQGQIIFPPCKVGQKVYVIHNTVERIELGLEDCIYETVIDAIHISGTIEYHLYYKKIVHPDCDFFTDKDIDETVFFAREEAVRKLKERKEDEGK